MSNLLLTGPNASQKRLNFNKQQNTYENPPENSSLNL